MAAYSIFKWVLFGLRLYDAVHGKIVVVYEKNVTKYMSISWCALEFLTTYSQLNSNLCDRTKSNAYGMCFNRLTFDKEGYFVVAYPTCSLSLSIQFLILSFSCSCWMCRLVILLAERFVETRFSTSILYVSWNVEEWRKRKKRKNLSTHSKTKKTPLMWTIDVRVWYYPKKEHNCQQSH